MNNGWQYLNPQGVRITRASTPPANPTDGDLHYQTGASDLNYLFQYDAIRNAWLSIATKSCTYYINGTMAAPGGTYYMQMNGMGTVTTWGPTEEAGFCHATKDTMIIQWMWHQQNATVGAFSAAIVNQVWDSTAGEVVLQNITNTTPSGTATEKEVDPASLIVSAAGGKGFIRCRVTDTGSPGNTLIYPNITMTSKLYLAPV